jgi:long-subunit fatty acid transport protein
VILSGENNSYAVYNAAGQIVNSGKTTGKATTTGFLPKGLYVVRINNQTAKIIL